jgi:hypothetical protein
VVNRGGGKKKKRGWSIDGGKIEVVDSGWSNRGYKMMVVSCGW